jgi:hypothetical protein
MSVNPHSTAEFERIAKDNTILLGQVGSGLHGVTTGDDDRDEMGVCLEPPAYVIGNAQFEQYIFRTQPEGVRSGAGDLDLNIYSLRKWARLAAQGNPTILLLMFIPADELVICDAFGADLQAHPERFLSRQVADRFAGYLVSQRDQMLGLKSKKHTNRPELVEQHGFDCYLDDTEFLTRRGWLLYDQIDDGDELATINQDTGQVEFQRFIERVSKPYSGPILTCKTRYSEWAVTPNHRMRVSKMRRGSCGVNPRAYNPATAAWGFRPASDVTRLDWYQQVVATPRDEEIPVSDAHLALIGAFVSEGSFGKRRKDGTVANLQICQVDGGRLHETMVLAATEYAFRTYRFKARDETRRPGTIWTFSHRATVDEIVKSCGDRSETRRLPDWALNLSARQIDVLLDALLSGDGTPHRTGGWVYYTTSWELAGQVQAIAVMRGRRANVRGPYVHDGNTGMYQVLIHDAGDTPFAPFRGRDVKSVDIENRSIVCFTVPNETLVTRRNGHVAMHGNTKFAYHMVRLGLQGVEVLTTGRITLPIPEPDRTWLRELRRGEHTKEEALARADDLLDQLNVLAKTADLPERPDYDAIDRWLTTFYLAWWENTGLMSEFR